MIEPQERVRMLEGLFDRPAHDRLSGGDRHRAAGRTSSAPTLTRSPCASTSRSAASTSNRLGIEALRNLIELANREAGSLGGR